MPGITVGRIPNCTHFCGRKTSYKPAFGKDFSILGNPYFMKDESMRNEVCDKYDLIFTALLAKDPEFFKAVETLIEDAQTNDVILGCYCKPKRCHCDTIANYVRNYIS